jgi:hypothetical protein
VRLGKWLTLAKECVHDTGRPAYLDAQYDTRRIPPRCDTVFPEDDQNRMGRGSCEPRPSFTPQDVPIFTQLHGGDGRSGSL